MPQSASCAAWTRGSHATVAASPRTSQPASSKSTTTGFRCVDRACAATHLKPVVADLLDAGCEVRGDAATVACDPRVHAAQDSDWGKEFLDAIVAVRVIDGVDAALAHIRRYGSAHTDAIITADAAAAERFLNELDSAIVIHNASTQFADGGEFGMGAEIGIATGKIHARGPVGAVELTSYKYQVRGSGQTRP